MFGNNCNPYRNDPGVMKEWKIISSESSLKVFWFNAGFVEGILSSGKRRKLMESGIFSHFKFNHYQNLKFAIYWFNKGREYSEVWNCSCFDKKVEIKYDRN